MSGVCSTVIDRVCCCCWAGGEVVGSARPSCPLVRRPVAAASKRFTRPSDRSGLGEPLSGSGQSSTTLNYEVGVCPMEAPVPLAVTAEAPSGDVVGNWSGTWDRHDTDASGGFTLEIGRAAGGGLAETAAAPRQRRFE